MRPKQRFPISDMSFSAYLKTRLHVGTSIRVYHISTTPTPTSPIFASVPNSPEEPTTCESHFLAVSKAVKAENAVKVDESQSVQCQDNAQVLLLGVEILIFTTASLTTIFVSKADSTGFLGRAVQGAPSLTKSVIVVFLEWLIVRSHGLAPKVLQAHKNGDVNETLPSDKNLQGSDTKHTRKEPKDRARLVLSLFARAQNQYLFPGSIENPTKHVLDDRQLIRWWAGLLDKLVQRDWSDDFSNIDTTQEKIRVEDDPSKSSTSDGSISAYIVVPGCDKYETARSFFPSSARTGSSKEQKWHNSYPVEYLVGCSSSQSAIPIRSMIPRFPDDPKARYCDDLDDAGVDDKGQWRGVKTLQQFWETMEYRQECASGRVVGFIWVTFGDSCKPRIKPEIVSSDVTRDVGTHDKSKLSVDSEHKTNSETTSQYSGQADFAIGTSATQADMASGEVKTKDTSGSMLLLSSEQYTQQADFLISETDFGGLEAAQKSTREWINKVKDIASASTWGIEVQGELRQEDTQANRTSDARVDDKTTVGGEKHARSESIPQVNMLVGVRKKRKVEEASNTIVPTSDDAANGHDIQAGKVEAKTLSADLVRKKPKDYHV